MVLDVEVTLAPQNLLGLDFLNPAEMLHLSKLKTKYFQMTTSLKTLYILKSLNFFLF